MYACNTSQANSGPNCQSNPLLTVVEAYNDYTKYGTDTCLANPSASTCGAGATTLAWTWGSLATAVGGQSLNAITITSTPPGTVHVGTPYTATATALSNDPVAITSATTSICTVSNSGVVTFKTTGGCTLNFDDPGNFNYAPAPEETQNITVT
jgi:hypothetical protein